MREPFTVSEVLPENFLKIFSVPIALGAGARVNGSYGGRSRAAIQASAR
jgi:hypothetical protein